MVKDNSEILHLIKDRLNNKCNCGCSSLVKDLKRILTPKDCLPPTPYRFEEPHIYFLVINS